MLFIIRSSHEGRVCSGEFLNSSLLENNNFETFVDIGKGKFLWGLMVVNCVLHMIVVSMCFFGCTAITYLIAAGK